MLYSMLDIFNLIAIYFQCFQKYKLYKISSNAMTKLMTNEHFNGLYDRLNNKEKYHLIMNTMISKDLCHLVINNKYILNNIFGQNIDDKGLTFMNKYSQLIRYTLGYAWLTFYMEESIKKGYTKKTDRHVFDVDTASMLPYFPYSTKNIHICPYLPLLVDLETLNIEKNILGVEQIFFNNPNDHMKKLVRYGIANKELCLHRLKLCVSGNESHTDLLDNVNWSNLAITGSIMGCCIQNFNPLMIKYFVGSINEPTIDFIEYVNKYYSTADIDVMCNISNIYDFVDKIMEFKQTIDSNIKKSYKINSDTNITKLYSNKSGSIIINKSWIKMHLLEQSEMSYNDVLTNLKEPKIKAIIYSHYLKWFKLYLIKSMKENSNKFFDSKYHELFVPVSIDNINIIFVKTKLDKEEDVSVAQNHLSTDCNIKLEDDDKIYEQEQQFEDPNDPNNISDQYQHALDNVVFEPKVNFKFRISSSYLPHCFELFQIKYDDFFSTVFKFYFSIFNAESLAFE